MPGGLAGALLGWLAGILRADMAIQSFPTMGGFVTGETAGRNVPLLFALQNALEFGLAFGLIAGLRRGGGAYLRHQMLRRLLVRNRSIPSDYRSFLDYASRLGLLQPRGAGYEFMHRLLLEYFAAGPARSVGEESDQQGGEHTQAASGIGSPA